MNDTVAENLLSLRKQKKWSLSVASQNTGVSKAMLGQIERKESSPTITILLKISNGFGVPFSYFLPTTKSQCTTFQVPLTITTIFPYRKSSGFEVFIIQLAPGCKHSSKAHQPGTIEYIIVTIGELKLIINDKMYVITCDQGFEFNADQPHTYHNNSDSLVTFTNILRYTSQLKES